MQAPKIVDIGAGLHVNLFEAAQAPEAFILAFHGGGGVRGTPDMLTPFSQLLHVNGTLSVAATRYRTRKQDGAGLEDMRADAIHALAWARRAKPAGARLFLLGASFGGLLALDAVLGNAEDVAGLILFNPVTDTGPQGFENRVVIPARHAALSPERRFEGHPLLERLRCFLAHGDKDQAIPLAAALRFAALWPEDRLQMEIAPGVGHGFFNRAPNTAIMAGKVLSFIKEDRA